MLSGVKRGAVLVNIARGQISPTADLLRLLEEGFLSGVGLDVYDCERELAYVLRDGGDISELSGNSRLGVESLKSLMGNPKAVLTPHNAFNTEESVARKSCHAAGNLVAFLENGVFLDPIPLG